MAKSSSDSKILIRKDALGGHPVDKINAQRFILGGPLSIPK